MAVHGHLADDVLCDSTIGVLADLLLIGGEPVVVLGDGHRDIRIDVAHEDLILSIGTELVHDLLRIHVPGIDAGFLQLVRDPLRHVGEPLCHLVVEESLFGIGCQRLKVSLAGGFLLLLFTELISQARR